MNILKSIVIAICLIVSGTINFTNIPDIPEQAEIGEERPFDTERLSLSDSQANQIIAYARSRKGSTAFNGYCQMFVRLCYESAGLYAKIADSANTACNWWRVSTSKDDIPIGATVYFSANSSYGHVGIYTGNGCMIHALSTVREEKISDYWWSRYKGWGYQAGQTPTGAVIKRDTTAPTIENVSIVQKNDSELTVSCKVRDDTSVASCVFSVSNGVVSKYYAGKVSNGQASSQIPISDYGMVEGNYSVNVTAKDNAGNTANAAGGSTFVDLYAPEIKNVHFVNESEEGFSLKFSIDDASSGCLVEAESISQFGSKLETSHYDVITGDNMRIDVRYEDFDMPCKMFVRLTITDKLGHTTQYNSDIYDADIKRLKPDIKEYGYMGLKPRNNISSYLFLDKSISCVTMLSVYK